MIKYFILIVICFFGVNMSDLAEAKKFKIDVSNSEKAKIADKIFFNECSRRKEKLIWWNEGEDFASLGLGHFIWYPKGKDGPFEESFVELVAFFKEKNLTLPLWLDHLDPVDCPWDNRDSFMADLNGPKIVELRDFMYMTFTFQVDFIISRMEKSLYLILKNSTKSERVIIENNFYKVANYKIGVYALVDYINFKGEGIKEAETYKGMGWGLKQVLLNMDATENPLKGFVDSAIYVLTKRVENSPKERGEKRWLAGWTNRVNTYTD